MCDVEKQVTVPGHDESLAHPLVLKRRGRRNAEERPAAGRPDVSLAHTTSSGKSCFSGRMSSARTTLYIEKKEPALNCASTGRVLRQHRVIDLVYVRDVAFVLLEAGVALEREALLLLVPVEVEGAAAANTLRKVQHLRVLALLRHDQHSSGAHVGKQLVDVRGRLGQLDHYRAVVRRGYRDDRRRRAELVRQVATGRADGADAVPGKQHVLRIHGAPVGRRLWREMGVGRQLCRQRQPVRRHLPGRDDVALDLARRDGQGSLP